MEELDATQRGELEEYERKCQALEKQLGQQREQARRQKVLMERYDEQQRIQNGLENEGDLPAGGNEKEGLVRSAIGELEQALEREKTEHTTTHGEYEKSRREVTELHNSINELHAGKELLEEEMRSTNKRCKEMSAMLETYESQLSSMHNTEQQPTPAAKKAAGTGNKKTEPDAQTVAALQQRIDQLEKEARKAVKSQSSNIFKDNNNTLYYSDSFQSDVKIRFWRDMALNRCMSALTPLPTANTNIKNKTPQDKADIDLYLQTRLQKAASRIPLL